MNIVDLLTLDNASKFCEFKDTEYGDYLYALIDYCDQDDCVFFVDIETRDNLYISDLYGYEFVGFVSEAFAVSTVEEQYKCAKCSTDVPITKERILAVELLCSSCKSTEETVQKMQIQKTSIGNRNHGAVKRTNKDLSLRFIQQVCLWLNSK